MCAIPTKQITGDVSVTRHANIGGNVTARGSVKVGHNLIVEGWLEARNIKGAGKGLFRTPEALRVAYPNPHDGWWAIVGEGLPGDVYVADGGAWIKTDGSSGEAVVDLIEVNNEIAELREELSTVQTTADSAQEKADGAATIAEAASPRSVSVSDLDTMGTDGSLLALRGLVADAVHTRWCVQATVSGHKRIVGWMDIMTDSLQHVLTQVLTTHYAFTDEGVLDTAVHTDGEIRTYYRSYGLAEGDGSVPRGEWTRWREVSPGAFEDMRSAVTALQEAVWPLTLTFGVTPVTVEVGKQTNVIASWDVTREGKSVLADSTVYWDAPAPAGTVPSTQKTKTVAVSPTAPGVTAFRMHAEYNGMSKEKTVNVTAVYPTYFGKLAAGAAVTESAVKGMEKLVNPSRSFQQMGISLANQRICLAYPKSFGALASVKDGNNFETLTAYTRAELTMDGVAYYVYAMTEPVTATGVKQIYS